MRFFKPIKWEASRWLLTIRFSSVVTCSQPIFTMRVLIFTLLAVAVSATNYGYDSYGYGGGSYPSYSYSSYPSSYYGGYGSSLYGAGYGSGSGYGYGSGAGYGSGVSYGLGGSGYTGGLSSYTTAYKPAVYQTARYSYRQPHGTEAVYKSGYSPPAGRIEFIMGNSGYRTGLAPNNKPGLPKRSGIHVGSLHHKTGVQQQVEDVSQILLHEKGGADLTGARFGGISSQAALPKPATVSHGFKEVHRSGTHTSGSAGPQISFIRETAKVTGSTGSRSKLHAYDKVSAPVEAAVPAKIPSQVGGTTEVTADEPRISFTQDFSKDGGQIDAEPEIHSTDRISSAGVEAPARPDSAQDDGPEHKSETHGISDDDEREETENTGVSGLGIGEVNPPTTSGVSALPRPSSGSVHRSGYHGISSSEGPQITFIQGTSALRPSGIKTSSFDKTAAPRRPSYGSRVTGVQSNIPAPAFPGAAGPSRITFTQDFSRVSGRQTTGVKSAISTDGRLPGAVASQGYQGARRFPKPAAASKQPVADQPSFAAVYEQGRTHGVFPARSDGSKSIFAAGFADSHFANVEDQDGLRFSNFVVVPEAGVVHGKSSAFEHSTAGHSVDGTRDHSQLVVPSYGVSSPGEAVDRSNVFVAIPVDDYGQDKSSVLVHSTGVFPTGSLGEEKGSKGYSSSYSGYSEVSGESPRFAFSPDRSLLYTYNTPHLVSPFSYSGSKYYGGGSRKTIVQ